MSGSELTGKIDALLPQTQCTKCGYSGCLPYASAIAAGEAEINQCPPGGAGGIAALADLLGRQAMPLNPANGTEQERRVALIDEARCIGCTLCIQACPVDAIVGAAKLMHTVVQELCTGCDLCLPPCPVDCIVMTPLREDQAPWTQAMADAARARFQFRGRRLAREQEERAERLERKARGKLSEPLPNAKKAVILAAMERAKARKAAIRPGCADHLPLQAGAKNGPTDRRRISAKKQ
jgi:electron transport complex protein RnfB